MGMDKSLICYDDASKKTDPYGELKVLAGSSGKGLARAICERLEIELARSETHVFSEGNVFVRVLENVRGRDVFIVQGTDYPVNDNFVELLFWIDAFKRASATQVTAVIPYFSYAKGDKKDEPRVSIRARVCADCIEAAGADRVLTMDLHSPQIQGFFKIPVDHLYAMPVFVEYFRAKEIPDLVVAAPDVGFGKQAYKFGEMMHAPVAFGNKTRRGHDEKAEMLDIVGQVAGKNVLIVDDFTISGGTADRRWPSATRNEGAPRRHLRLRLARCFFAGLGRQARAEPDQGARDDRHDRVPLRAASSLLQDR